MEYPTQSTLRLTLNLPDIDHLKEIFSGSGTSHKVNRIAIQRAFIEPLPKVNILKLKNQRNKA